MTTNQTIDGVLRAYDVESAARKLADCMDYPWDQMPEKGRDAMREHAMAIVSAAISGNTEQPAPVAVALLDTGKNIDERRTFGSVQACAVAPMVHDFSRRLDDGLTADGRRYIPPKNMHSTPRFEGSWRAVSLCGKFVTEWNGGVPPK